MGNVVPALFSLPFLVAAVLLFRPEQMFAPAPLLLAGGFIVIGWMSLGLFGLFGNAAMKSEIGRRMDRELGPRQVERVFVGYSTLKFRGLLDAHEDIGFLTLERDELDYFGDRLRWKVDRRAIQSIRLRANVHSLVLLGGWIELSDGANRWRIEPRQADTLFGNLKHRRTLFQRLNRWKEESPSA